MATLGGDKPVGMLVVSADSESISSRKASCPSMLPVESGSVDEGVVEFVLATLFKRDLVCLTSSSLRHAILRIGKQ